MPQAMLNLILDSGAYSAWTRGERIDIDHYIEFIKANAEYIDHVVNLDVIPGSFGVVPDAAEVERSAQASWENLLYMQANGVNPIPVFHMGERFYWLRRMMEHGCTYIGISPANDRTTGQKQLWLDRVFDVICDDQGLPRAKTHAFGVTAIPLLMRYPWYSADSATWVLASARGSVMVPHWRHDDFDFTRPPMMIYMSGQRRAEADDVRDYRSLQGSAKAHCDKWFEACGVTLEEMQTDCKLRALVCARFFQEFERKFKPQPFKRRKPTFFEDA